jgi:CPA1 family monovalent cation:H+ antiporter
MDGTIEAPLWIELFVLLLLAATIVAIVARRAALPYSVALVLAGLGLAFLIPGQPINITPELILAVLLPGLVFEAAYKIDVLELRRTLTIVAVLAAPGVLITAGVVALVVSATTGLDIGLAFLLGAMISATDPVAVVSMFRKLGVPSRLATSVEAESLLNDGTGVVLFSIALLMLTKPVSLGDAAISFVLTIVVSAVIGVAAGLLVRYVISRTDDPLLAVMLSVVAAYGTYLIADRFHESGIIATVVVGLMIDTGPAAHLARATREALDIVWEFIAFILTALVFLLVGLVISPELLAAAAPVIVAGFVAITGARAFVVYGLIGAGERLLPGASLLPLSYLHVMFWSGLRGAIAIALVLALPTDLPQRELLTGAVYGIVLITLLFQGTTASRVVRRAGVPVGGSVPRDA